jgi:hypothetical protein
MGSRSRAPPRIDVQPRPRSRFEPGISVFAVEAPLESSRVRSEHAPHRRAHAGVASHNFVVPRAASRSGYRRSMFLRLHAAASSRETTGRRGCGCPARNIPAARLQGGRRALRHKSFVIGAWFAIRLRRTETARTRRSCRRGLPRSGRPRGRRPRSRPSPRA